MEVVRMEVPAAAERPYCNEGEAGCRQRKREEEEEEVRRVTSALLDSVSGRMFTEH